MRRIRSEDRFPDVFQHAGTASIRRGAIESGLHVIAAIDRKIDVYLQNRETDTLIVTFCAALPAAAETLPVFQGLGLAQRVGVSCLAVSDPSIYGTDLDLGWCLGRWGKHTVEDALVNVIRTFQEKLGVKRTLFFGASGGGYAAILVGRHFDDSSMLCVNPRLDFLKKPRIDLPHVYGQLSGDEGWETAQTQTILEAMPSAFDLVSNGFPGELFIFQNTGDEVFYNNQFLPFVENARDRPSLDIFCRAERTGKGHGEAPKWVLDEIVSALLLSERPFTDPRPAGFTPLATVSAD